MVQFTVQVTSGREKARRTLGRVFCDDMREADNVATAIQSVFQRGDKRAEACVTVPQPRGFAHIPLDSMREIVEQFRDFA